MKLNIDKYDNFFFDFDGVIVDSVNIKTEAFGELFRQYGKKVVSQFLEYHKKHGGVSRYEKFRYCYLNLLKKKITRKIMLDLDRKFSNLVLDKVVSSSFIGGAKEFLELLKDKHKSCFVISATPRREIRRIVKLKKLGVFFKDVAGSPGTKQENLEYFLNKFKIRPDEALYFGDAKSDYDAAKQKGIYFIGLVNKNSRELKNVKAIRKIRDFCSLKLIG